MPRHSTIHDLARALRDHLIAWIPETDDEVEALKALGDEIAIALLRRRPSPRYAVGIDHGTPEGSKGVVGLFKNGVLVWKDEPGDVDDGPRVTDRSGSLPVTHMAEQAWEWIKRMETKPTLIKRPFAINDAMCQRVVRMVDDELDEEERGEPSPWSSTWDG